MNDWLIGLVGAGAALLGVSLQFIFSLITENKKRKREVRENRINLYEEYLNQMFTDYLLIIDVALEMTSESKMSIDMANRYTEKIKEISDLRKKDKNIFIASGLSLHDKELNKLIEEFYSFRSGIPDIDGNKIISNDSEYKNETHKKLRTSRDELFGIISRIYNRLDYLRAK